MKQAMRSMRSGAPLMALLAFAFFLRILVPSGWMPAHGEVGFIPCPAAALLSEPSEVQLPHHGAHAMHHGAPKPAEPPADEHGEKKGCDFAPLGLAWALTSPPPAEITPLPVAATPFIDRPRALVGQGLAAPPPPATGPPAHA